MFVAEQKRLEKAREKQTSPTAVEGLGAATEKFERACRPPRLAQEIKRFAQFFSGAVIGVERIAERRPDAAVLCGQRNFPEYSS